MRCGKGAGPLTPKWREKIDAILAEDANRAKRLDHFCSLLKTIFCLPPRHKLTALEAVYRAIEADPWRFSHAPVALEQIISMLLRDVRNGSQDSPSDLVQTSVKAKLVWIIGWLGQTSMSVKAMRGILALLRAVIEGHAQPLLARLLLGSLRDMTKLPSQKGTMYPPRTVFNFSGNDSSLRPPPFDKWASSEGYTFCAWLMWRKDRGSGSRKKAKEAVEARRVILSVWGENLAGKGRDHGVGFEISLSPRTGTLFYEALATSSEAKIVPLTLRNYDPQQSHLQNAKRHLRISAGRWHFMTVVHSMNTRLNQGRLLIWIDGILESDQQTPYPVELCTAGNKSGLFGSAEPRKRRVTKIQSTVGMRTPDWGGEVALNASETSNSPAENAKIMPFQGQMGSVYLFERPLSGMQVKTLFQCGPDYQPSTVAKKQKPGLFRSFFRKQDDVKRNPLQFMESLKVFYSPMCLGRTANSFAQLALDISPVISSFHAPLDALVSKGVEILRYDTFATALYACPGGLFQIVWMIQNLASLQRPSAHQDEGESMVVSYENLLPSFLWIIAGVLAQSRLHRWEALSVHLFQMVGSVLSNLRPDLVTADIVLPLRAMLTHLAWRKESRGKLLLCQLNDTYTTPGSNSSSRRGSSKSDSSNLSAITTDFDFPPPLSPSSSSYINTGPNANTAHGIESAYLEQTRLGSPCQPAANSAAPLSAAAHSNSSAATSAPSRTSSAVTKRFSEGSSSYSSSLPPASSTPSTPSFHSYCDLYYGFAQDKTVLSPIPLNLATERTLFNDFVHEILLNFKCWCAVEQSLAKQSILDTKSSEGDDKSESKEGRSGSGSVGRPSDHPRILSPLVELISSISTQQPQYFGTLIPVPHLLYLIKIHFGYSLNANTVIERHDDLGASGGDSKLLAPPTSTALSSLQDKVLLQLKHTRRMRCMLLPLLRIFSRNNSNIKDRVANSSPLKGSVIPGHVQSIFFEAVASSEDRIHSAELFCVLRQMTLSSYSDEMLAILTKVNANLVLLSLLTSSKSVQECRPCVTAVLQLLSALTCTLSAQDSKVHFSEGVVHLLLTSLSKVTIFGQDTYACVLEMCLGIPPGQISPMDPVEVHFSTALSHSNDGKIEKKQVGERQGVALDGSKKREEAEEDVYDNAEKRDGKQRNKPMLRKRNVHSGVNSRGLLGKQRKERKTRRDSQIQASATNLKHESKVEVGSSRGSNIGGSGGSNIGGTQNASGSKLRINIIPSTESGGGDSSSGSHPKDSDKNRATATTTSETSAASDGLTHSSSSSSSSSSSYSIKHPTLLPALLELAAGPNSEFHVDVVLYDTLRLLEDPENARRLAEEPLFWKVMSSRAIVQPPMPTATATTTTAATPMPTTTTTRTDTSSANGCAATAPSGGIGEDLSLHVLARTFFQLVCASDLTCERLQEITALLEIRNAPPGRNTKSFRSNFRVFFKSLCSEITRNGRRVRSAFMTRSKTITANLLTLVDLLEHVAYTSAQVDVPCDDGGGWYGEEGDDKEPMGATTAEIGNSKEQEDDNKAQLAASAPASAPPQLPSLPPPPALSSVRNPVWREFHEWFSCVKVLAAIFDAARLPFKPAKQRRGMFQSLFSGTTQSNSKGITYSTPRLGNPVRGLVRLCLDCLATAAPYPHLRDKVQEILDLLLRLLGCSTKGSAASGSEGDKREDVASKAMLEKTAQEPKPNEGVREDKKGNGTRDGCESTAGKEEKECLEDGSWDAAASSGASPGQQAAATANYTATDATDAAPTTSEDGGGGDEGDSSSEKGRSKTQSPASASDRYERAIQRIRDQNCAHVVTSSRPIEGDRHTYSNYALVRLCAIVNQLAKQRKQSAAATDGETRSKIDHSAKECKHLCKENDDADDNGGDDDDDGGGGRKRKLGEERQHLKQTIQTILKAAQKIGAFAVISSFTLTDDVTNLFIRLKLDATQYAAFVPVHISGGLSVSPLVPSPLVNLPPPPPPPPAAATSSGTSTSGGGGNDGAKKDGTGLKDPVNDKSEKNSINTPPDTKKPAKSLKGAPSDETPDKHEDSSGDAAGGDKKQGESANGRGGASGSGDSRVSGRVSGNALFPRSSSNSGIVDRSVTPEPPGQIPPKPPADAAKHGSANASSTTAIIATAASAATEPSARTTSPPPPLKTTLATATTNTSPNHIYLQIQALCQNYVYAQAESVERVTENLVPAPLPASQTKREVSKPLAPVTSRSSSLIPSTDQKQAMNANVGQTVSGMSRSDIGGQDKAKGSVEETAREQTGGEGEQEGGVEGQQTSHHENKTMTATNSSATSEGKNSQGRGRQDHDSKEEQGTRGGGEARKEETLLQEEDVANVTNVSTKTNKNSASTTTATPAATTTTAADTAGTNPAVAATSTGTNRDAEVTRLANELFAGFVVMKKRAKQEAARVSEDCKKSLALVRQSGLRMEDLEARLSGSRVKAGIRRYQEARLSLSTLAGDFVAPSRWFDEDEDGFFSSLPSPSATNTAATATTVSISSSTTHTTNVTAPASTGVKSAMRKRALQHHQLQHGSSRSSSSGSGLTRNSVIWEIDYSEDWCRRRRRLRPFPPLNPVKRQASSVPRACGSTHGSSHTAPTTSAATTSSSSSSTMLAVATAATAANIESPHAPLTPDCSTERLESKLAAIRTKTHNPELAGQFGASPRRPPKSVSVSPLGPPPNKQHCGNFQQRQKEQVSGKLPYHYSMDLQQHRSPQGFRNRSKILSFPSWVSRSACERSKLAMLRFNELQNQGENCFPEALVKKPIFEVEATIIMPIMTLPGRVSLTSEWLHFSPVCNPHPGPTFDSVLVSEHTPEIRPQSATSPAASSLALNPSIETHTTAATGGNDSAVLCPPSSSPAPGSCHSHRELESKLSSNGDARHHASDTKTSTSPSQIERINELSSKPDAKPDPEVSAGMRGGATPLSNSALEQAKTDKNSDLAAAKIGRDASNVKSKSKVPTEVSISHNKVHRRNRTSTNVEIARDEASHPYLWRLSALIAAYRRRYRLKHTAVELFFKDGSSVFLHLHTKENQKAFLRQILNLKPPKLITICSRKPRSLLERSGVTQRWMARQLSNFEYLMHLNTISGRTFNDLNQYPVFPWVLKDYASERLVAPSSEDAEAAGDAEPQYGVLDVICGPADAKECQHVFRDLSKPMGALDPKRLKQVLERFKSFSDTNVPPFHYGSHYSNAAIVCFFLLRLEPFASLHKELQGGKFDFPDRLFSDVNQTWSYCNTSPSSFKELIPEFFYLPDFLRNINAFDLGTKQDSNVVSDVHLPAWAKKNPKLFVDIMRLALESEHVSKWLPKWIDLIFGYRQRGKAALDAHNLFHHLTYEGGEELLKNEQYQDQILKDAVKLQIAQFGQTPIQLFTSSHPSRSELLSNWPQDLTKAASNMPPAEKRVRRMRAQLLRKIRSHEKKDVPSRRGYEKHSELTNPCSPRSSISSSRGLQDRKKQKNNAVLRIFRGKQGLVWTISSDLLVNIYAMEFSSAGSSAPSSSSSPSPADKASKGRDKGNVDCGGDTLIPSFHLVAKAALHTVRTPERSALEFLPRTSHLVMGTEWGSSITAHHCAYNTSGTPGWRPTASLKIDLTDRKIWHLSQVKLLAKGRDTVTIVTSADDTSALVWDFDPEGKLNPRHIIRGQIANPSSLAVETRVDLGVVVGSDSMCLVFSPKTGQTLSQFLLPKRCAVLNTVLSVNGDMVFSGAQIIAKMEVNRNSSSTIQKCDINGENWVWTNVSHGIKDMIVSEDGTIFVTVGGVHNSIITVWDTESLQVLQTHKSFKSANSIAFIGNDADPEAYIGIGNADGTISAIPLEV